jgi:hypothetical protein
MTLPSLGNLGEILVSLGIAGGLAFLISLILISLSDDKLSSRTKNTIIWGGTVIGFVIINVLLSD